MRSFSLALFGSALRPWLSFDLQSQASPREGGRGHALLAIFSRFPGQEALANCRAWLMLVFGLLGAACFAQVHARLRGSLFGERGCCSASCFPKPGFVQGVGMLFRLICPSSRIPGQQQLANFRALLMLICALLGAA